MITIALFVFMLFVAPWWAIALAMIVTIQATPNIREYKMLNFRFW